MLMWFQDSQFPINFCESETCQCNIQLEIEKEASIVAGDDSFPEIRFIFRKYKKRGYNAED